VAADLIGAELLQVMCQRRFAGNRKSRVRAPAADAALKIAPEWITAMGVARH